MVAFVDIAPAGDHRRERLLDIEKDQQMIAPHIGTITFFKGDPAKAMLSLKERLGIVVAANPWLAGTLTQNPGPLQLCYSAKPLAGRVDELFNPSLLKGKPCKKALALDSTMSWEQMCLALMKTSAEVPPGNACVNKGFPLVALTVVPDTNTPHAAFAVVFSASHVILDGHNYYQLLNMLSSGGEVETLSVTRKHEIKEANLSACGLGETKFVLSGAVIFNVISKMLFGKKPVIANYFVDAAKLTKAKAEGTKGGSVDFVSTNDVLLASFGKATDSRVMLMPIDWRGKLPVCSEGDAGNYEGCLVFTPSDFEKPSLVRRTLKSGRPFLRGGGGEISPPAPLPGRCTTMCCRLGMITNWTFAHFNELKIEGAEHLVHMPVTDPRMVPFEFGIVYRPRAHQLALATFTRACSSEKLLEMLPLGEEVRCS